MQLDRVPPPRAHPPFELHGTIATLTGVVAAEHRTGAEADPEGLRRHRRGWKDWALLSIACWWLLGQGERFHLDPHFSTPGATLATYWEALRTNDGDTVTACFVRPENVVPLPGMLWFLPPSETVTLSSIRYSAGEGGTVVATYVVRFRPIGSTEEMRAVTSTELVRIHGEWRIERAANDIGLPDWRPFPQPFDI